MTAVYSPEGWFKKLSSRPVDIVRLQQTQSAYCRNCLQLVHAKMGGIALEGSMGWGVGGAWRSSANLAARVPEEAMVPSWQWSMKPALSMDQQIGRQEEVLGSRAWAHISQGRRVSCQLCGFCWSPSFLPYLCPLGVPEVGVCGVYSESP